jgi:hypothetical protein
MIFDFSEKFGHSARGQPLGSFPMHRWAKGAASGSQNESGNSFRLLKLND